MQNVACKCRLQFAGYIKFMTLSVKVERERIATTLELGLLSFPRCLLIDKINPVILRHRSNEECHPWYQEFIAVNQQNSDDMDKHGYEKSFMWKTEEMQFLVTHLINLGFALHGKYYQMTGNVRFRLIFKYHESRKINGCYILLNTTH